MDSQLMNSKIARVGIPVLGLVTGYLLAKYSRKYIIFSVIHPCNKCNILGSKFYLLNFFCHKAQYKSYSVEYLSDIQNINEPKSLAKYFSWSPIVVIAEREEYDFAVKNPDYQFHRLAVFRASWSPIDQKFIVNKCDQTDLYEWVSKVINLDDLEILTRPDIPEKIKIDYGCCPLPDELISELAQEKVIEMCAGNGYNFRKITEAAEPTVSDDSIIAFDILPKSRDLRHGEAGNVEDQYPDRTLLICAGYDAEKSVEVYTKAGGKKIVLGGYLRSDSSFLRRIDYFFPNVDAAIKGEYYSYSSAIFDQNGQLTDHIDFNDNHYIVDLRPNFGFMKLIGWKIEKIYVNRYPSDDSYESYLTSESLDLRIYVVYTRISNINPEINLLENTDIGKSRLEIRSDQDLIKEDIAA